MHSIHVNNRPEILFPEHIGELNNTQYLFFCHVLAMYYRGDINFQDLKVRMVYHLMDMVRSYKILSPQEEQQRNESIFRLASLIDGFFTETKTEDKIFKTLNLTFVDNKLPSFIHNGITYYGPKEALLNITLDEFITALDAYKSFSVSNEEADLNELIAVLYRPKKPETKQNKLTDYDGDIRQEFYKTNVHLRAKQFETLHPAVKLGVKLFFEACLQYITNATNVMVQGKEIDLSVLFQGTGTAEDKSIGMLNVLFSLAETNVFGDMEKTGKTQYWTILLKLYQNHIDAEKQQKQLEDAKRNRP